MIDHMSVAVSDYQRSKSFYTAALKPLGYGVLMEIPAQVAGVDVAGLGEIATKKPDFWLATGAPKTTNHIAFRAQNREQVQQFYQAALAAGGRDNGGPGVRAHYHANYYGAFVLDPDGHNVEAVCHDPAP
jgi:catechol 2,3-dioxygenase-like lactoylglutathione lyase family enzyme